MTEHRTAELVALLRYLADEIEAGRCDALKSRHETQATNRYEGPGIPFMGSPDPKHLKEAVKGKLTLSYVSKVATPKTPKTPDEEVEAALAVTP